MDDRTFYIVLALGIVLAIAFMRDMDKLQEYFSKKECPHCKERVKKDAKICPHCHKDL